MSLDNSINNDMSLFPQEDEEAKEDSLSASNNMSQQEKTAASTMDLELFQNEALLQQGELIGQLEPVIFE